MAAKPVAASEDAAKVKICPGHTRPICHINYSNIVDGSYWFVSSCHDSKPMIRNGETGDWVGTFVGHKGAVYSSAFNAEATRVVTGSGDFSAALWDSLTGECLHSWDHPHYVKSVDWMDGRIATGNHDSKLRIFDATNYDAAPFVILAHDTPIVKSCYFVGDSNTVVTSSDGVITRWDLRDGKETARKELPGLNVLEYTHSNFLVAAYAKSVAFLDPRSLLEHTTISTMDDVECASMSPDGKSLAVGSKIKAKEYTMDGMEVQNHRGHHGPIFHVRWAPDGHTFTTGAEDGMIRIWPCHNTIVKSAAA